MMKGSYALGRILIAFFGWAIFAAGAAAQPRLGVVVNPSFEADKFTNYPGHARVNGGTITGWKYTGAVGVNPWWEDAKGKMMPMQTFSDNGRVPHGRQVALMQNKCTLSQTVSRLKAGKRYVVTYYENARSANFSPEGTPCLQVTLGGEVIVSLHPVQPVEQRDKHTLPYAFVESAVFTAPADGSYDLVFTTTVNNRVTVLIDNVTITEVK